MSVFLQILGSFSSIAAIPLAVYLYLRSKEAKFSRVRQEIRKVLSYQIGEGRSLSTFEIQTVINSKLREYRFGPDVINAEEVIEDLVAETITNPMLDKERKEDIIKNLQNIHNAAEIHRIVGEYTISSVDLLESISSVTHLVPKDLELLEAKEIPVEVKEMVSEPKYAFVETLSSLFALIATIVTVIAFFIGEFGIKHFVLYFRKNPYMLNILLGMVVSVIGGILAFFISYVAGKKREKRVLESPKRVSKYEKS